MVTYLAKFVPNLSEITSPLRNLLAKDILFQGIVPKAKLLTRLKT